MHGGDDNVHSEIFYVEFVHEMQRTNKCMQLLLSQHKLIN